MCCPWTNAVEIHCGRDRKTCSKAFVENGRGSRPDRILRIGFQPEEGTVQSRPSVGCDGSERHAVLIGDPLRIE